MDLDKLQSMFARHVRHLRGGVALGSLGSFRVSYFLDLLSAAHHAPDLELMASMLESLIRDDSHATTHSAVACPKRGNPILGLSVARKLSMPSLFVRDEIIFSSWIEGIFRPNSNVILIDDVSSDGELLRDAVHALRKSGLYVSKAFVLVDREEGNAAGILEAEGVEFKSLIRINDDGLGILQAEHRAAAQP